ncbi:tetraacyldisaccharide 4'-kinase [Mesonia maritima]|uniref:Tetraacyldisaccharide 4'-kinase n=1 Tax=Mesonia maritima TaxID=1793873 RepID=A0ABU1K9F2_9FLAO|nr:tetraacyldisaccharide 4'-kinase [Mesonia maritima]MDR6302220.1 tetraacyldisaccharide 4'-kinase [Mesonia maritima]
MQLLRKLLFPFSILYGSLVWFRNKLYDWNIKSSKNYDFPVICVGNLSVGGTGKSPMIEYLIELLKDDFRIANLSRGYKRTSSGFYVLKGNEKATLTGDEPLQFKRKFPAIEVAVHENRQAGIRGLRDLPKPPEVILLDDAFQHRKVEAGLNILLTSYGNLFCNDFMLPTGNLREPKAGAKRAQIIIVTKCPENLSANQQNKIKEQLKLDTKQKIYFSRIVYDKHVYNENDRIPLENFQEFTLITGIANPKPLVDFLKKKELKFNHLAFPDHHNFNAQEIERLSKVEKILTTEKDFMRLKGSIPKEKLFYIPIKTAFLQDGEKLNKQLTTFVNEF